jgi:hypothetical protein
LKKGLGSQPVVFEAQKTPGGFVKTLKPALLDRANEKVLNQGFSTAPKSSEVGTMYLLGLITVRGQRARRSNQTGHVPWDMFLSVGDQAHRSGKCFDFLRRLYGNSHGLCGIFRTDSPVTCLAAVSQIGIFAAWIMYLDIDLKSTVKGRMIELMECEFERNGRGANCGMEAWGEN